MNVNQRVAPSGSTFAGLAWKNLKRVIVTQGSLFVRIVGSASVRYQPTRCDYPSCHLRPRRQRRAGDCKCTGRRCFEHVQRNGACHRANASQASHVTDYRRDRQWIGASQRPTANKLQARHQWLVPAKRLAQPLRRDRRGICQWPRVAGCMTHRLCESGDERSPRTSLPSSLSRNSPPQRAHRSQRRALND